MGSRAVADVAGPHVQEVEVHVSGARRSIRGPRLGSRRPRRDSGFSYVEVLVSVLLLGTAGVAVLGAAAQTGRGATVLRTQSDVQTALAATSDALNGITPVACATAASSYQTAARTRFDTLGLQRGWTNAAVTVTNVQSFNPTSHAFDSGCTSAGATQKVTITITAPDGSTKSIDVLTGSATATTPIGNPLAFANSQFSVIAQGDVTIAGTQVYGALAVGGNLTFNGQGPIAANSTGTFGAVLGANNNIGLIVDGSVNFTASSNVLYVNSGAAAVIGDMTNGKYIAPGGTNCFVASTTATQCAPKEIAMQNGGNVVTGHPFDFAAAFDAYKKTSTALGQLPGTCVNAASAVLRDQNNAGPWPGSGNFTLILTSGKANTLNLTAAQVNSMAGSSAVGSSSSASNSTPLIINVLDAGSVSFNVPNFPQNYPRSVIWNFPNATAVTFNGALWGSLYAPLAAVTLTSDVRGVVIGGSVIGNGGVADWSNRPDIADIICDRAA
ncbi:MAG: spaP [Ilumatobacteraceae bacterium]|nr:spaP [Ilumatobacteraceae bacterium]